MPTLLIFFVPIALYFLYPYHFALPYFETDFVDYCVAIEIFDQEQYFPPKRSKLAAIIPWSLSRFFGTMGGLAAGAWVSICASFLILIRYAQLFSKTAGLWMIGLLLCCSPFIGLSRMLNFYPEICLFLFFSATSTAFFLQKTTPLNALWAGIGIASCFLVDARGLIWGAFYLVLALFQIGRHRKTREKWKAFLCLLAPIWLSWFLARWSFHAHSSSLIRQIDTRPLINSEGSFEYPSEFIWGYSSPSTIPANIQFLWENNRQSIADVATGSSAEYYWIFWFLLCSFSLLFLLKTPNKSKILFLPLLPFALSYWSINSLVESHVRFFAQSLPILAVPIAVLLGERVKNKMGILLASLFFVWSSLFLSPHWAIEREISHRMLQKAFPLELPKDRPIRYGNTVHIQTLPVRDIEREITKDWENTCIESLQRSNIFSLYD